MPNYEICNKLCKNFKSKKNSCLPEEVRQFFCNADGKYLGETGWRDEEREFYVYCLSPEKKSKKLIGQPPLKSEQEIFKDMKLRSGRGGNGHASFGGHSHG